jgi:translation initiation factor IF-2
MTMEKARVKDLSVELGVSNKELLQALREIGIQAKSHMSTLTEEEADEVKAMLKDKGTQTEVVRKEIQPGMVVRRRRKPVAEDAKKAKPEAPEVEQKTAPLPDAAIETPEMPTAAEDVSRTEEQTPPDEPAHAAPVHEPVVKVIHSPADREQAQPPTDAEPDLEPEAEAPQPAETAETVEAPEELLSEETAPVHEGAEATGEAAPETALEPTAPAKGEGEQTAAQDAEAEARKKKKRKKKKEISPEPQVRIISRPDPVPETPKIKGPLPEPTAPDDAAPAPRTVGADKPADADAKAKKGRKKDKRVVEFPQSLPEEEDRRRTSLQIKKKKALTVKDKTGGKVRSGRRRRGQEMPPEQPAAGQAQNLKATKRKIKIDEAIRLSDLAHQMGIKAQALIKVLFQLGVMATINQSLDMETATLVASEFGYEVEKVGFSEADYLVPQEPDSPESLKPRPPVVTIMGHVDHGKTSLLDAIRESHVTLGEAGGITQHIGAYHVSTPRGEVVFLDTPGHEAFTAMRARGAQVTDVVILVVAADDGVMDQTREAVNHSKAAGVPIMVAVNKIDKEGADPDRARRELSELGLLPEDWGGETIYANVSAKNRVGIDELLEMILLQAEVMELKANPDKFARGRIVEARLDKGRGAVATLLMQEGTLKQGDNFVCGLYNGRVRAMFNDQGKKVKEAGPTMPVEVQGFEGVPEAGDEFVVVEDDKVARRIAEARQLKEREKTLAKESKVTLETFLSTRAGQAEVQTLNLVVKADVQGSLEAVNDALTKLSTDEVKVNLIHGGTGAITETDVMLASASHAIIIGFNVRPTAKVKDVAEKENVDIRFYDIIYKLVNEIKDALSGMLSPLTREVYLGQAEVRETFSVPKVGTVAGCAVADGKITRNAGVRLLREGVVIFTGTIASLKRFKDDVKEVTKGYECGIGLEKFNDIKVGDVIEAFEEVQEARTLE